FYAGACNPCHALVVDDVAEHNAVGFSGTNASGDVAVVRSQWRDNAVGIVPNSLDTEPRAPQDGMTIAGNLVADSSGRGAPRSGEFGGLTGTGIALVGVLDDVVVNNRVEGSAASGIVVTPNPGIESRVRAAQRNRVEGNVVVHSASHDLVWADANATDANCFARNTFRTSAPRAIERAAPCAGAATAKLTRGALSSARVFARPEHRPRRKPRQTPAPAPRPDMPDAATAPARPATAEPSIAVDPAQLPV